MPPPQIDTKGFVLSQASFDLQLVHNSFGIEHTLHTKEPLEQVVKGALSSTNWEELGGDVPYFSGRMILWTVLKSPFEQILSIVFRLLYQLTHSLSIQLSQTFSVLADQMGRDWAQLVAVWNLGVLVPAWNVHQLGTYRLYQNSPIPIKDIEDPRVVALTSHATHFSDQKKVVEKFFNDLSTLPNKEKLLSILNSSIDKLVSLYNRDIRKAFNCLGQICFDKDAGKLVSELYVALKEVDALYAPYQNIHFFSNQGLSRGASTWFIYLYLKTLPLSIEVDRHLFSVAEQFRMGIPNQAALIQPFWEPGAWLNMDFVPLPSLNINCFELDYEQETSLEKINSLPPGTYRLSVLKHALVYIKIDDQGGYMWDCETGLMKVSNDNCLRYIASNYHKSGDPRSQIDFYECHLKA